jgi:PilZ domain
LNFSCSFSHRLTREAARDLRDAIRLASDGAFDEPRCYNWGMQRAHVLVEQRKHPRAHLRLPARLRWQGPLGMRLELTETIDVARDGVLVHRGEDSLALMSRVWIAFPFDADDSATAQPETPGRVVRCGRVEDKSGGGYRVALRLEQPRRELPMVFQRERRAAPRAHFSLPVFVRAADKPFPEESMTRDFSRCGMRFETSHVYACGEKVLAKVPWGEWAKAGEIAGRVLRVDPLDSHGAQSATDCGGASAVFTCVAVQWLDQEVSRIGMARMRNNKRNGAQS